ncbi:hypothetical protein HRV97_09085 [Sphingomonas sp. HHU CXW]|uniref:Uncharacterized protein n=1 Tax=Sphingomonas hominis TaxID=2741495 RepID=A0ABX2JFL8_9SPHN|nr:DUF6127 family protein [Sphingomonas hominis]NTS65315.1 hypothetical protein [Sphingomonas hominis]
MSAGAGAVLAQLLAQGAERGADMATLRGIAEEAGELGATRALTRLGLADDGAGADVAELRELLKAWRDAKRSAWKALVAWVARMACALLLLGLAVKLGALKLGVGEWVK